ncbi:MAG: protein adenylyltransferase SelO [Alphaproteobacteria bacterium]
MSLAFENSYAQLPERFFARQQPAKAPAPHLIRLNGKLARDLGIDPAWLKSPEGIALLSGNYLPDTAQPLAMAYAGHQFGGWVPQLGDGRAILLGELDGKDGIRRDVQLKGSGRTPFSRSGDGRAALGPVLREYIVSEAMAALGVPTTRALAAITTGETIFRETPLPGAIVTRVAKSHVRVGTFQYFTARQDHEALALLADHVIARLYPEIADSPQPYRALLDTVVTRQAELIARWMAIGFIHGVMNTDNMAISGETIDYGPCAFMDAYHPETVFSSIDRMGRYAYANQPAIAHWNLSRLAQAMLPILGEDADSALAEAQAAIDAFPDQHQAAWLTGMRRKLGLEQAEDDDKSLADDLLAIMADNEADFTLTFRRLAGAAENTSGDRDNSPSVRDLFRDPGAFDLWATRWHARLAQEPESPGRQAAMQTVNPAIIPRNHRIAEVIEAAEQEGDFRPFHALVEALATPCDTAVAHTPFADPPRLDQIVQETFCGT